jgi:5'-nucleotidase
VAPLVSAPVTTSTGVFTKALGASGEAALGDLLAEAHRVAMGAQLGITNPGGMRADLPAACATPPCSITWGDCFTTQPFNNQVMKVTLTGAQLAATLEQQFSGWAGQTQTRMLQISGFKYAWSLGAALGSKVVPGSLQLADGTPIDPAASYSVALNNYLQGGGDGFAVLKGGTGVVAGPFDIDALVTYLGMMAAPISPATDGRITQVP